METEVNVTNKNFEFDNVVFKNNKTGWQDCFKHLLKMNHKYVTLRFNTYMKLENGQLTFVYSRNGNIPLTDITEDTLNILTKINCDKLAGQYDNKHLQLTAVGSYTSCMKENYGMMIFKRFV